MFRRFRVVLPLLILTAGVMVAWLLTVNSPRAHRESVAGKPPLVKVTQVSPQNIRIPVHSQGTVLPAISINLSAEVTGRIIETSPSFANGAFFKKGDVLVRINPRDHELAITKAEALVASARQQLARAEAEYKQKVQEYKGVAPSKITDYALRKPQYEEAKATLKSAQADLDLAKVQLQRCEIRAPFDGRVVEKKADLGQYVTPGMMLANVYATDVAEIRLPLSQSQISLLDLPFVNGNSQEGNQQVDPIRAVLTGQSGDKQQTWESQIVRKEAIIDERNRLQYVVAQVKDPYGLNSNSKTKVELTTGLFVTAKIDGRQLEGIVVLPRQALHHNNTVWLLDKNSRLIIKTVEIIYRGKDKVYISQGLARGDAVIISPLDTVVNGMQLRVETTDTDGNEST